MHQKWLIAGCWIAAALFLLYLTSEVIAYQPVIKFGNLIDYDKEGQQCMFNYRNKKGQRQRISLTSTILFALIPLLINLLTYSVILYKLYKVRSARVRMISLRACLICVTFTLSWLPCFILYDLMGRYELRKFYHMALFLNCFTDPVLYAFTSKIIKKKLSVVRKRGRNFKGSRKSSPRVTFQLSINMRVLVNRRSNKEKPTPY